MRQAFSLLALVIACSTTHTKQLDVVQADHDQVLATEQLHVDAAEQAHLDEHQLVTSGPGEEIVEHFTPDGGLAERVTRRWGPRKLEAWQSASMAGEEHIELDAGVVATHDDKTTLHQQSKDEMHPAASCAAGGYLWALAVIAIAVTVFGVARKLRP